MATSAQLRYSPLAGLYPHSARSRQVTNFNLRRFADNTFFSSISVPSSEQCNREQRTNHNPLPQLYIPCAGGGGDIGVGRGDGGGGGDSRGWSGSGDSDESRPAWDSFGPIGAFVNGWRSRVAADPQFPFKVLMEELVGVSANVIGDMASRPNFGLNELDFVFSTLVVGSIVNFVIMYLLAPTMSSSAQSLPGIFAGSPMSHMFEPGPYSLLRRLGTFVYKGTLFAAVGFAAGLVGTAISNGVIKMRKKMDPNFETPNKAPPTILNAATWAIHMGLSSNFRYQTLNGVEFVLEKGLPPFLFKTSVLVLRCLNNLLGGMTFVILARLTGSQSVEGGEKRTAVGENEKLLKQAMVASDVDSDDLQTTTESTYK